MPIHGNNTLQKRASLSITIHIYRLVGWSALQFSIISAVLNWEIDAGMQKGSIEMQFDRLECLRSTPLPCLRNTELQCPRNTKLHCLRNTELQCPRNRELKSSEVDFKDRLPPCKKGFDANLTFVPLSLTLFDPECQFFRSDPKETPYMDNIIIYLNMRCQAICVASPTLKVNNKCLSHLNLLILIMYVWIKKSPAISAKIRFGSMQRDRLDWKQLRTSAAPC